ncbi:MAG TPA: addiction module protein [Verrucomicrobiota bacterium]|nr:addiction module protein [Verrucomicrobiota bacterium]HQL77610.1 addiction module protein [Verrucomicrobiota bacterium]
MSATKVAASTKDLFIEALSLPIKSRARLAHRLLISLEQEEVTPESEAAWDEEAERRYEAFKKGKIKARSAEAVMRDAYKRVR